MPALYKHPTKPVQNQARAVLFAGAGERRGRAPEPQFAAPPVATRNGLARPLRIGAPTAFVLTNVFSPENSGRTYFVNLTDGTIAQSGPGDLKVWVKRPGQITSGQRYDWSCEVDAINGGLLEQPLGSAMYAAPSDGYISSFGFDQTVGSGWGDSTGERQFYVTFNNGQEYGRVNIELFAYYNNQTPGLMRLSYTINPSGSRVLR